MTIKLDDPIVEVIELASEESTNVYLHNGWVLLCTGFTHVTDPNDSGKQIGMFVYSLGRPQSVQNYDEY